MKSPSGTEIKCPLYVLERVRIIEVFFKKICMRILSVHGKLSVIERCPYQRGVRMERFDCIDIHSHLAREVKINLKQRFGMFVKKEKFHPRWDSIPQSLSQKCNTLNPLRHGGCTSREQGNFCFHFQYFKHHFFSPTISNFFTFAGR